MNDLTPLNSWLRVSTWDTHHPSDQELFYKAVYKLILNNEKLVEPQHIQNYIVDYHKDNPNKEHVMEIADIYAEKYNSIFNFLYENKIML